ncbi:MAG: hypothetical protein WC446_08810 [Candidatus Paceibacterota bacterium]
MMNDQEKIASQETRKELNDVLGFSIQQSTSFLEDLLAKKKVLKGVAVTREIEAHNAFVDFFIFLNYVTIELSSITRSCLRAEIPAEKQYHLKFINCIILEIYKNLYGYGKSVKRSLWKKNIEPLCNIINDPQFLADFETIETQIIKFGDSNITDNNKRVIGTHYDLDPIVIDKMLRELNEYDETQRALAFLPLLCELFSFSHKYIRFFYRENFVDSRFPEGVPHSLSSRKSINYLNKYLISKLDEYIIQNKKGYDRSIHSQKWIQQHAIQEKDNPSFEPLLLTLKILKVQSFMDLLIMDLAAAKKAYFMAEYSIEKHLCLKHINTIIYEGFKKLYGLDNNDETYWNSYILPIENKIKSDSSRRLLMQLDQKLQMLRPTIKGLGEQRHLSVHLKEGVEKICAMLVNLKPVIEFQKQQDFINTIMQIFVQSVDILKLIEKQLTEDSKESRIETIQKAEKVLGLLENSPDCPGKDETIKTVQQIISGEFFENIMKKSGVKGS